MADMKPITPPTVTIEPWFSPIWGHRFSAMYEGRSLATRGTEPEIRRLCAEHGWTVVDADSAVGEGVELPAEQGATG